MAGTDLKVRWSTLGETNPRQLEDARLQLHWAAQLAASFGQTLGEPKDDDSHRNMIWWPSWGMLVSNTAAGPDGVRLGLVPGDFELFLFNRKRELLSGLSLPEQTLDEAYAWLAEELEGVVEMGGVVRMERPEFSIPDHAVARGSTFLKGDGSEFDEVARWFDNANALQSELLTTFDSASDVRCWPHHFDVGFLITLPNVEDGSARSIGVGMTPGDVYYPEPYFYVAPHPTPASAGNTPLDGGGHWHQKDWFGAVLTGTELLEKASRPEQQCQVSLVFLTEAISTCHRMLMCGEDDV